MISIIDIKEKNRQEKSVQYYKYFYPNREIKIIFEAKSNREKDLVIAVNNETNCWEVVSHKNGNPYPMFRKERVHILSYKKYKGEIPDGMVIRHTCDNYRCCNPDHLILGTQKENVHDIWERNRGFMTLSKEEIIKIALDSTDNYTNLAKKYNIPREMIERIKNKKIRTFNTYETSFENKHKIKLTDKEVLEIFYSNESAENLAEKYNISKYTVYDIKKKRYHKKILEGKE